MTFSETPHHTVAPPDLGVFTREDITRAAATSTRQDSGSLYNFAGRIWWKMDELPGVPSFGTKYQRSPDATVPVVAVQAYLRTVYKGMGAYYDHLDTRQAQTRHAQPLVPLVPQIGMAAVAVYKEALAIRRNQLFLGPPHFAAGADRVDMADLDITAARGGNIRTIQPRGATWAFKAFTLALQGRHALYAADGHLNDTEPAEVSTKIADTYITQMQEILGCSFEQASDAQVHHALKEHTPRTVGRATLLLWEKTLARKEARGLPE